MNLPNPMSFTPDPWNRLYLWILTTASAVAVVVLDAKFDTFAFIPALLVLLAVVLFTMGWLRLLPAPVPAESAEAASPISGQRTSSGGWILLGASLVCALIGSFISGASPTGLILVILPFVLAALAATPLGHYPDAAAVLSSLLWAGLFLGGAAALGAWNLGIFPAIFAFCLNLVLVVTRRYEHFVQSGQIVLLDPHARIFQRSTLGWMSVVFFVFGVVSLWPWLGMLYSNTYLWILIIGVLAPTMYLWGRLRQPRHQPSVVTLARFNHLMPYIALVLIVALAVA